MLTDGPQKLDFDSLVSLGRAGEAAECAGAVSFLVSIHFIICKIIKFFRFLIVLRIFLVKLLVSMEECKLVFSFKNAHFCEKLIYLCLALIATVRKNKLLHWLSLYFAINFDFCKESFFCLQIWIQKTKNY